MKDGMLVRSAAAASAKLVIAGGFGAGKTTLVASVSEIDPLTTEAAMTVAGAAIDRADAVQTKTTTTVALDFGRLTIADDLVLYLFGTPGQERFGFMWDDLALGALGALILVDTRRITDCFPAVDYFERRAVPFVLALNEFPDTPHYPVEAIRDAVGVPDDVPVVRCDARSTEQATDCVVTLLETVLAVLRRERPEESRSC